MTRGLPAGPVDTTPTPGQALCMYAGLDINACPGQVNVLHGQVKDKFTCPIGQITWKKSIPKATITAFIYDIAFVIGVCDRVVLMDDNIVYRL